MWDKMLVMAALRLKICALQKVKRVSTDNEIIREKITSIIYEFLLLVDQTKEELKMNGWIHMPEYSEENVYYKLLRGKYEAFIYNNFFLPVPSIVYLDLHGRPSILTTKL